MTHFLRSFFFFLINTTRFGCFSFNENSRKIFHGTVVTRYRTICDIFFEYHHILLAWKHHINHDLLLLLIFLSRNLYETQNTNLILSFYVLYALFFAMNCLTLNSYCRQRVKWIWIYFRVFFHIFFSMFCCCLDKWWRKNKCCRGCFWRISPRFWMLFFYPLLGFQLKSLKRLYDDDDDSNNDDDESVISHIKKKQTSDYYFSW